MRLLIVTQAVDRDDPVLGFFHRWIEELANNCISIHVICLKEGRHALPPNVIVHSLGKESGESRFKYLVRFYSYIWKLRREHESVFVHMNQEYVLLGGLFWRAWKKKIVLWRNHKQGSWMTGLAGQLADTVCYTSTSAYVANFTNACMMPIGIDTKFFAPTAQKPATNSILFLGRLDPVKRVDVFVRALEQLHEQGISFTADIVGDPTDSKSDYAHDVRNLAAPLALDGIVAMHAAVTNDTARDLFASHAIYCNLTPSGSFDKTIGEAMASGSLVVSCNDAVRGRFPENLFVAESSVESVTRALSAALTLTPEEHDTITAAQRTWIEREHSLKALVEKLLPLISEGTIS